MRRRRGGRVRSDEQILAHAEDVDLLRAVAGGRVGRGEDGLSTAIMAPHYLDGEPVRLNLQRLAREDLVEVPISGAPSLAPRGRLLLQIVNGEIAMPLPE